LGLLSRGEDAVEVSRAEDIDGPLHFGHVSEIDADGDDIASAWRAQKRLQHRNQAI
jgi:hypothetical protein